MSHGPPWGFHGYNISTLMIESRKRIRDCYLNHEVLAWVTTIKYGDLVIHNKEIFECKVWNVSLGARRTPGL